jgi:hypothetical protein
MSRSLAHRYITHSRSTYFLSTARRFWWFLAEDGAATAIRFRGKDNDFLPLDAPAVNRQLYPRPTCQRPTPYRVLER